MEIFRDVETIRRQSTILSDIVATYNSRKKKSYKAMFSKREPLKLETIVANEDVGELKKILQDFQCHGLDKKDDYKAVIRRHGTMIRSPLFQGLLRNLKIKGCDPNTGIYGFLSPILPKQHLKF